MAKNNDKQDIKPEEIKVKIPDNLRSGVYSNTVSVTATNTELTLNFIYMNPTDSPKGTLVSRVVIPPEFAVKLSEILSTVQKQIQEKSNEAQK